MNIKNPFDFLSLSKYSPNECKSDIYYEFLRYCINNSGPKGIADISDFIKSKRDLSDDNNEIILYFRWLIEDLKQNELITGDLDVGGINYAVENILGDYNERDFNEKYTVKVTFKGVDYVHQRINNNTIVYENKRNNLLTAILAIIALTSILLSSLALILNAGADGMHKNINQSSNNCSAHEQKPNNTPLEPFPSERILSEPQIPIDEKSHIENH